MHFISHIYFSFNNAVNKRWRWCNLPTCDLDPLSLISNLEWSLFRVVLASPIFSLFSLTEFSGLICWQWQAKEMERLNSIFHWALWRTGATFTWWIGRAKYSNKYPKGWIWEIIYHLALSVSRDHLTFLSYKRREEGCASAVIQDTEY